MADHYNQYPLKHFAATVAQCMDVLHFFGTISSMKIAYVPYCFLYGI